MTDHKRDSDITKDCAPPAELRGCGCSVTYPQLVKDQISHGPGCMLYVSKPLGAEPAAVLDDLKALDVIEQMIKEHEKVLTYLIKNRGSCRTPIERTDWQAKIDRYEERANALGRAHAALRER